MVGDCVWLVPIVDDRSTIMVRLNSISIFGGKFQIMSVVFKRAPSKIYEIFYELTVLHYPSV